MTKITINGKKVGKELRLTIKGQLDGSTVYDILDFIKSQKGVQRVVVDDSNIHVVNDFPLRKLELCLPPKIRRGWHSLFKRTQLDPERI